MTDYYVSTAGEDTAPGTRDEPFASFEPLASPASPLAPGDTVYVRGGTIRSRGLVLRDVRGRPGAPISIVADGNTIPVVDCSAGDGAGIELDGCAGITIRGLVIRGAARDGIRLHGAESGIVTVAGVEVHDYARSGSGNGIHVTGAPDLSIRGCYLREGAGPKSSGILIAGGSGRCRILGSECYRNPGGGVVATDIDDPDRVVCRRCIAHRNGFDTRGERAAGRPGFRIDGGVLDRCIAYNNGGPGFDAGRTETSSITHATAWANGGAGYRFGEADLTNCLAAANRDGPVERTGDWNGGGRAARGGRVDDNGVVGTDASGFRSTDDTRPEFLRPRDDSRVVDSGIDLGRPHAGSAPDAGARPAVPVRAVDDDGTGQWLANHSEVLRNWRPGA